MRKHVIFVVALTLGLLAQGCLRPFRQRFTTSHDVDFASAAERAELAEAVSLENASVEAVCRKHGYEEVLIRDLSSGGNRFFLATDHARHRHLIVTRGTSNLKNVKLDVEFEKAYDPTLGIRLHRGFRKSAKLIFDEIAPRLNKEYDVALTGHSLGGAQALVLGMYFHAAGWKLSDIITFGQPKVTDKRGARKFASLPLTRFVNVNDPVPLVPPRELRYLSKQYRHLGREVTLLDGLYYSFLEDGNESDPAGSKFWYALDDDAFKTNLPQHYMATYRERLAPKTEDAEEVPYKDRLKHFTP